METIEVEAGELEGWSVGSGEPVLMIHGKQDTALLPAQLNDNWDWIDGTLTLIVVPDAGHFIMQDAPDVVSSEMLRWLGH